MNTLFDKIWDTHVVTSVKGGPDQLYIDRHYCHEVTSPQAFNELRARNLKVFRPKRTTCSPDHNIPTLNQDKPIADPVSRNQVETLATNASEFGLAHYGLGNKKKRNHSRYRTGIWVDSTGNDHRLRRQPHFDPRGFWSRRFRYWHERSCYGIGIPMYFTAQT